MSPEALSQEIETLNISYLLLAQRLIHHDKADALVRLGMDSEMADVVAGLSVRQMSQLARSNQLLTRLSPLTASQLQQVTDNPRDKGMSSLHTSLMLLSRKETEKRTNSSQNARTAEKMNRKRQQHG